MEAQQRVTPSRQSQIYTAVEFKFARSLRSNQFEGAAADAGPSGVTLSVESGFGTDLKLPNADEAYRLLTSDRAVHIKAATANGLFNGVQTLLQLLPPTEARNLQINQIQVELSGGVS